MKMYIRKATIDDVAQLAMVEAECFPAAEAATEESLRERVEYFGNHFWLMFNDEDKLISFVDGFCTNEKDLTDEMYERACNHDENGEWQMIFGVNTIPSERGKGYARTLLKEAIKDAENDKRKGLVLTCKDKLIGFYETVGFQKEFISESTHGGAVWYQMRISF